MNKKAEKGITFSVVVPIYNSENTIERCLDSIVDQNFDSFELLITDDGSTDESVHICERYVDKYDNIRLFKQSNAGASAARNKSLDAAVGEYVAFIDSDDYILPGYFDIINKAIEEDNPDVIFLSHKRVFEPMGNCIDCILPEPLSDYYSNVFSLNSNNMFCYTWAKVFKREIIGSIRFKEDVRVCEDEIFTCEVMRSPVSIRYIFTPLYCYVRGNGTTLIDKSFQDYALFLNKAYVAWDALVPKEKGKKLFLQHRAEHYCKLCYWYAMERDIEIIGFSKQLSRCSFFIDANPKGAFPFFIKHQMWIAIIMLRRLYYIKTSLSKVCTKGITSVNKV